MKWIPYFMGIDPANPLLFDFHLKRCLAWKGLRWPASVLKAGRMLR